MFRKFMVSLCLCNIMLGICWFGFPQTGAYSKALPAYRTMSQGALKTGGSDRFYGNMRKAASGQRVVDYNVMKLEYRYQLSKADYEALLKIVQAEAGSEDEVGKMLVAGVVLNRVEHEDFPDTVKEVIFQQEEGVYQFSPVANGSYESAHAVPETVKAVEKVLKGEDVTKGALYFAARKYADQEKMHWFDQSLNFLFAHGGHEFFTEKQ